MIIETRRSAVGLVMLSLATLGCGDDETTGDPGSLSVLAEAEDTIIEGIDAGEGDENIKDGWSVGFDKFIVAIGDVELHQSSGTAGDERIFAVDLTAIPAAGLELWTLKDLEAGRWDFSFKTPGAAAAERHETVSEADFEALRAGNLTYWIEGTLTKDGGKSCPPGSLADVPAAAEPLGNNAGGDDCYDNATIAFALGVEAATVFGPCEIDSVPGVSIPAGGTQTVATTIHGDHLFFNGFPEGDEGGTSRLAQWLADSDLNLDGEVTKQELEAIAPSDLAELDERYQLGGSPISPLETMWDYVRAQLKTQGHFQGEGECPVDGTSD